MKISIVIPSYNQDQFIGQTLDSILKQKGEFTLECLVFDGGSSDKTVPILKKIELDVKNGEFAKYNQGLTFFWVSEKDKGQSDAINKGLVKVTGEIIAFLNSDDTYEPGTLQKVVDAFEEEPQKKWLTGFTHIINEKNILIQKPITAYKNFWLRHYSYSKLLMLNFISQPATFWKKEIVEKFGLFDVNLHYVMDYEYWLRIGRKNNPIILSDYLANFRIHSQSKGGSRFVQQFKQDLQIAKKYSHSKLLSCLHSFHNFLIITVYKLIK